MLDRQTQLQSLKKVLRIHSAKCTYVPPDGSATDVAKEPVLLGGSVCCGSVASGSNVVTENSAVDNLTTQCNSHC